MHTEAFGDFTKLCRGRLNHHLKSYRVIQQQDEIDSDLIHDIVPRFRDSTKIILFRAFQNGSTLLTRLLTSKAKMSYCLYEEFKKFLIVENA